MIFLPILDVPTAQAPSWCILSLLYCILLSCILIQFYSSYRCASPDQHPQGCRVAKVPSKLRPQPPPPSSHRPCRRSHFGRKLVQLPVITVFNRVSPLWFLLRALRQPTHATIIARVVDSVAGLSERRVGVMGLIFGKVSGLPQRAKKGNLSAVTRAL